jgi:Aldehyde dehydrogenase family
MHPRVTPHGRNTMKIINKIYINGQFISPIGQDVIDIINPSNKEVIGQVTLGNELDTRAAVAAAKAAFTTFSKSSIIERGQILQRLHDAIIAKSEALNAAAVAWCSDHCNCWSYRVCRENLFTREIIDGGIRI